MPRRPFLVPVLVGVFFLTTYMLTGSSDLKHNGDTDLRYQTTQAIVDYHRLWIAQPMWLDERVTPGRGGHLYVAAYAPGQVVFMIPLYIAGRFLAHHLSMPYDITTLYTSRSLDLLLGAALAVVFFLLAESVGYRRRTSILLTLIFGLATVIWPDVQSALEQTQVDLFLLLAVFGVWLFVKGNLRNRWWLVAAGTAAGLGLFTRYDFAIYLPLLALYPAVLRWHAQHRLSIVGDWLAFGIAILPWAISLLVWNYLRFGSPFDVGLHLKTFGEPIWQGFLGLTVSPGKGLIWYLPLLFLLPWAIGPFYRRIPSLATFFAGIVVVTVLFYSNVLYWHGDPAWGPRYLYTTIPYLILPIGEILSRWRSEPRLLRVFTVLLVLISLGLQVAAISVTGWRFWYRLESMQEHTAHKFEWGPTNYTYYWNPRWSPILIQTDDVYQVIRLDAFGDTRFLYTGRPTACTPARCISNPADNYPINTLAFWWADAWHPLLGPHTRAAIAIALGLTAVASGSWLLYLAFEPPMRTRRQKEREFLATQQVG